MSTPRRTPSAATPAGRALAVLALVVIFAYAARAEVVPDARAVAETPAIPQSQIPPYVLDAVNAPDRPATDKALDAGRQPAQWLAFFGIAPGMKVADLFAGDGYTTELLARIVGPTGTIYSQNGPFPARYEITGVGWLDRVLLAVPPLIRPFKVTDERWRDRRKEPALKNVVEVDERFDSPALLPVQPGTLDAVIFHLAYHDMVWMKVDRAKLNRSVFTALKAAGVYGIVDHSDRKGSGDRDTSTLHRIDEEFVIADVEKAGFKLAARSSALRHPEDDRTWIVFLHRGQTDRFILKFVKPQ